MYWSHKSTPPIPWLYFLIMFGHGLVFLVGAPFLRRRTIDLVSIFSMLLPINVTALLPLTRYNTFTALKLAVTPCHFFVRGEFWHVLSVFSDSPYAIYVLIK